MENNNIDPVYPQKQDTPDPLAPMENNSDLTQEPVTEVDEDELIHQQPEKPSEENKVQDADDAVHKNYKPANTDENQERDPDDAVHGL